MPPLFDIRKKTIVITGGTGVLGRSMAKGLADAGANVVILGRNAEAGMRIENEIASAGGRALFTQADVLSQSQLEIARDKMLQAFGTIDVLVNAAGGNLSGAVIPPEKNIFDLDVAQFDRVVELNLNGTLLPVLVLGKVIAEKRKGGIINIASMASFRPITRVVGYSASKAAVMNFTEWLAVEMARKFGEGVRVNAIAPGFFLTEQNRELLTHADGTYTLRGQSAINHTPFNRFGDPLELVGTLIWLCSDASAFVTGVTIPVDGGFNAFCGV